LGRGISRAAMAVTREMTHHGLTQFALNQRLVDTGRQSHRGKLGEGAGKQ